MQLDILKEVNVPVLDSHCLDIKKGKGLVITDEDDDDSSDYNWGSLCDDEYDDELFDINVDNLIEK